jgi:hypothetical protein
LAYGARSPGSSSIFGADVGGARVHKFALRRQVTRACVLCVGSRSRDGHHPGPGHAGVRRAHRRGHPGGVRVLRRVPLLRVPPHQEQRPPPPTAAAQL